jgi:hypothetical protein
MLTEAPPPGGTPGARTVEEEFLALICADEQLLQAEFDAIIAAEWPTTPARPGRPSPDAPSDHRRYRGGHRGPRRRIDRPRRSEGDRWARQRSPPPTAPDQQPKRVGDACIEPDPR